MFSINLPTTTFPRRLLVVSLAVILMAAAGGPTVHADSVYLVRQSHAVKDLPPGAQKVRGWFWMPENRPFQEVLDFRVVRAPSSLRITRDPGYGRSWLYAEAVADPTSPLEVVTEFKVRRRTASGLADPALAGPITAEHRRTFAAELRRDERHMEITPAIQETAAMLAGPETNPVVQARRFFDYVIASSDHYSKFDPAPFGLCLGDAMECMSGSGDCCTDQHALFIALCRARDIPCRLMFGSRLKMENEGRDYDPGYRCWPTFFAPGLGWVPLDVSSGDTGGDRASEWFGGLDDARIEWAEGRDFELEPRSDHRPDLVIRGWVEVDGKHHTGLVRTLNFRRLSTEPGKALATAVSAPPYRQ